MTTIERIAKLEAEMRVALDKLAVVAPDGICVNTNCSYPAAVHPHLCWPYVPDPEDD